MRSFLAILAIIAIWWKQSVSFTDFNISRITTESINGTEDGGGDGGGGSGGGGVAELISHVLVSAFLNSSFEFSKLNLTLQQQTESKYPDVDRNCSQLIESRGFIAETHEVVTEDGYILTLFRIVNPNHQEIGNHRPVFVQHGMFGNSDMMVNDARGRLVNGVYMEDNDTVITDCLSKVSVGRTIGFVLSHCGYDVWLGNTRGNKYSTAHRTLDPYKDVSEYWSFNIDHLAYYDLTASIHYVLHKTNHKTLGYIGHSLGTTMMFQLLATKPQYSNMIKPFIALAPIAYLSNQRAAAFRYLSLAELLVPNICARSAPVFKYGQQTFTYIAKSICGNPLTVGICIETMFSLAGADPKNLDVSRLPAFMSPFPDASSWWVMCQLARRINRKSFAHFDYGYDKNWQIYGSSKPPPYQLEAINSTHITLISGANDFLANPKDVARLSGQLKVPHRSLVMRDPDFNHIDFIFGTTTGHVNQKCLRTLRQSITTSVD